LSPTSENCIPIARTIKPINRVVTVCISPCFFPSGEREATTITNQVGLEFSDLMRIYVAGAFGRHIDPAQAITLGMLPDQPLDTFVPIGNSSLAGAEQVLLERADRERCREMIRKITYLELNVNQEFMLRFSGSRFIPHTDHTLFPSVPFFDD